MEASAREWISTEEGLIDESLTEIVRACAAIFPLPKSMGMHPLANYVRRRRFDALSAARSPNADEIQKYTRRQQGQEPPAIYIRSRTGLFVKRPGLMLLNGRFRYLNEDQNHIPYLAFHEYFHFFDEEVLGRGGFSVAADHPQGRSYRDALSRSREYEELQGIWLAHAEQLTLAWVRDLKEKFPEPEAIDREAAYRKAQNHIRYLQRYEEYFVRICMSVALRDGDWTARPDIRSRIEQSMAMDERIAKESIALMMELTKLTFLPPFVPRTETVDLTFPEIQAIMGRLLQ